MRQRNFIAKKEKRDDSEINWAGNANVVVVLGDSARMISYWKKIEQEGAKPEDVVSDAYIRDFLSKVLIELSEVNPAKKSILIEVFQEIAEEGKKSGLSKKRKS